MFNSHSTQKLPNFSHPLVQNAYLKKEIHYGKKKENVLVLEVYGHKSSGECTDFDPYLVSLLQDLQKLRSKAEEQTGTLKHIEIIRH